MSNGQDNKKEFNIIVNGRPKKVTSQQQSFDQIVALAFDPIQPNALYTVTYSHGHTAGSLVAGKSIDVVNGMQFDVTETGQS